MPRYHFFILFSLFVSLAQAQESSLDLSKSWFKPVLIESRSTVCKTILKAAEAAFFSGGYLYSLDIPGTMDPDMGQFPDGKLIHFGIRTHPGCGGGCEAYQILASAEPIESRAQEYALAERSPPKSFDYQLFKHDDGQFYLLTANLPGDSNRMLLHKLEPDYSWRSLCELAVAPDDSEIERTAAFQVPRAAVAEFEKAVKGMLRDAGDCGTLKAHDRHVDELHANSRELLYRPWVAVGKELVYEERVKTNLDRWSLTGVSEHQAYLHYQQQLLRSSEILADFYSKQYGWSAEQAAQVAGAALNRTTVDAFAFSSSDYEPRLNEDLRRAILKHLPLEDISQNPPVDTIDLSIAIEYPEALEYLLKKGGDPNQVNAFGKTPLMYAAQYNQLSSAKLLLDHGADPNAATTWPDDNCYYTLNTIDMTALHYAARYASPELIRLLVDRGAQPAMKTQYGYPYTRAWETPLDWLRRYTAVNASERNINLPEGSITEVEKLLAQPSAEELARFTRALVLKAEKEYADQKLNDAYRKLSVAVRINPSDERALNNLALVALRRGLLGESLATSHRLRTVSKDAHMIADAWFNEGLACEAVSAEERPWGFSHHSRRYCKEGVIAPYYEALSAENTVPRQKKLIALYEQSDAHSCAMPYRGGTARIHFKPVPRFSSNGKSVLYILHTSSVAIDPQDFAWRASGSAENEKIVPELISAQNLGDRTLSVLIGPSMWNTSNAEVEVNGIVCTDGKPVAELRYTPD